MLDPRLFSSAYVSTAVAKARIAEPRTNVKLVVAVRGANVRSWVARVTKRFSRQSVDATLAFKGERPVIHGDRAGRSLNAKKLTQRIVAELASNSRLPVRVHTVKVAPTVSADAFAHVITINRSTNRLTLYDDGKLHRTFPVATGQAIYPTPRGTLPHRRQVPQPVVVPADLELVGAGAEACAARAVEPARHALDGHLGPRRRDPRHRRAGLDRLQRLARLRADAGA